MSEDAGEELKLLSINQVRIKLGIRYSAVVELLESGKLEFIEMNSRKKIPMIKLRNFIDKSSKVLKDKRETVKSFETFSIRNKLKKIIKKHERD